MFDPDPVELTNEPNALIVYTLDAAGYAFPNDGTALVISGGDSEFPIAWYVNDTTISLGDYNNKRGAGKDTLARLELVAA